VVVVVVVVAFVMFALFVMQEQYYYSSVDNSLVLSSRRGTTLGFERKEFTARKMVVESQAYVKTGFCTENGRSG
jgi:hypothetical protein